MNTNGFRVSDDDDHTPGDPDCGGCGWPGYPKPCPCGGLLHVEFGEEGWDWYSLITKCDRCGCNEEEVSDA